MQREKMYNLIVHGHSDFWQNDQDYVDFPQERFLEYTSDDIKSQFASLDNDVIKNLKKLPTLFATEQEQCDTRIGYITNIEIKQKNIRISFKFNAEYNILSKNVLCSPELDIEAFELHRTHWAIKKVNLDEFLKDRLNTAEGVLECIKSDLDAPLKKDNHKKISTLYACNATGKTRISKLFYEKYKGKILYYNAFTEDLFNWDNENYILKIDTSAWIFQTIQEQGLDRRIIDNFQKITGSKLEPVFDIPNGHITFGIHSNPDNIKISRGEESIFIWSIFYTILEMAINELNIQVPEDRSTQIFNDIEYIIIDDPVSSMDDTRIITVALELGGLITKSNNHLKFLITTHHALFFNMLFNFGKTAKNLDRKNYVLSKTETGIHLKSQNEDSPFAYHHVIIAELSEAISNNSIRRYHFNLFRSLLEKTANFLGHQNKNKCFEIMYDNKNQDGLAVFKKTLEHYSHNSLSDLEPSNVSEVEQVAFKQTFDAFIEKFNWDNQNAKK